MNLRDTGRILALTILVLLPLAARAQWTPPTPEELSMTAQPEVPGAAAVYLYKEETTDDDNHNFSIYVRLKVLNDHGKEYANVELPYQAGGGADANITEIAGRTIHPDGTVIPFTGKPFEKLVEKNNDTKVMSKVFSLPDVQVGSIIEYRYKMRYEDNYYISPDWYIQSELFLRKGHYAWKTTTRELMGSKGVVNSLAWFPILPKESAVKVVQLPGSGAKTLSVDVANIPPTPNEDFLPPMASLTDRVLFYYSSYRNADEFWASEGKDWSKQQDKFIGPGPAVKQAVQEIAPPSDPPIDKLKKIYAACMDIENTVFTRTHTQAEERAQGVKEIRSTDDVLTRKRGSDDQITELFIAMARAAGFKAYAAGITSRDRHFFLRGYLSMKQIDDLIAIVNVDGKDLYFDPGQRYIPFQHLAWKHTMSDGIRQMEKGTGFVTTPNEPYSASNNQRIADLILDKEGIATGTVRLNYTGPTALYWRQKALRGDATSLDHDLIESIQTIFGTSMDVKVEKVENLKEYEQPLKVSFSVKGPVATSAGRRALIVSDLFEAQDHPTFPSKERKDGVFFHYGHTDNDVVRIHYPEGYSVESIPKDENIPFEKYALYRFKSEQAPGYYTIRRDFIIGQTIYTAEEFPRLRTFFTSFETKDREPVVIKPGATTTTASN
ncbi:Transglutaminase-like superfamily protein [Granulicella pectinivorans]|uniref:Transglutaminase-like superfamily protein n=1 Tax=Granulicella pectinivorans TaxID=474950 RepID=A0A1I6MJJ3_9BACT|nr:DUF3857 domain-containing protein [Granulicella pectinivorans]SFS15844.1 Transglutaminase-like superfamily protein [Granulicella pectinivorans]